MTFDSELGQRALRVRQGLNEIAARSAQRLHPEYGECFWVSEPASAAFAGDGNPLTQSCGAGFSSEGITDRLDGIAAFYASKGCKKWELILTPFEPAETFNRAIDLGLRLDHHESVLFFDLSQPLAEFRPLESGSIEPVESSRFDDYARASIEIFFGTDPPAFAQDLFAVLNGSPADRYVGLVDGKTVAVGSSVIFEDTVFLGGMGTLEAHRGRGFQSAMVQRRLHDAKSKGVRWAMIETVPGSGSQRNAMRAGFQVAYTAAVWMFDNSR